jgi:electron transfer flavoprotein alpha/beta subunit
VTTICKTTRPRVITLTARLVLPRPDSFRASMAVAREDIHAGTNPEPTAARIVAATAKISTGASMLKVMYEGMGLARLCVSACR